MSLHEAADKGFSDAASYDTHRPTYPATAVDRFLANLELNDFDHASVIDLAAGTGKLTEALVARPEAFSVLAVEPHAGMRGELERKALPRVKSKDGFAEKIPAADESADAVVVGQAFHWFATREALREIARVVKPTGTLGLIWNIEEYNKPKDWPATTAWEEKLNQLVHSLSGDDQPRFRDFVWKNVFETQLWANPLQTFAKFVRHDTCGPEDKVQLFSLPIGEDSEPFVVWLTRDALWKRLSTLSHVALLEGAALKTFRAKFDEILKDATVESNDRGEVAVHGKTYFAWTSKV